MTFNNEQREAIEQAGSVAVTIDGIECVALRADLYNKVRAVLSDDLSHDELRALLARSAENSDWWIRLGTSTTATIATDETRPHCARPSAR